MDEYKFSRIGVIGAGSWGTTLANLLAEKGHTVDLWVREEEVYQQIKEKRVKDKDGYNVGIKLIAITRADRGRVLEYAYQQWLKLKNIKNIGKKE